MNITPLADNILVKRALPTKFAGSIALPTMQYDDKTTSGTVFAVGPKVYDVKVLDVVTFPKYANKEFTIEGEKYLMLREEEIFAVIG